MDFGLHNEPNASSILAKEVRKPTYNRINLLAVTGLPSFRRCKLFELM